MPPDWSTSVRARSFLFARGRQAEFISCCNSKRKQDCWVLSSRPSFYCLVLQPPLNDLDRINHICLLWGFPLLTVGIIAGTVFAGFAWKSGWPADPKIVWTFPGRIIYGFLLHQRLVIGWKGFRVAVVSCAGFLFFFFSFIGVRFFFTT